MKNGSPFILFRDDWKKDLLLFSDPVDIICARNEREFYPSFAKMEEARIKGKWLAGYISYEAGFLLNKSLKHLFKPRQDIPLICFGVFNSPPSKEDILLPHIYKKQKYFLHNPQISWDYKLYKRKFEQFYQNLRCGNCYQGNITFPITAEWLGDPLIAFCSLIEKQPVRYGSLVSLQEPIILSRSPELFFYINDKGIIETRPMKGTAPRGKNFEEDQKIIDNFKKENKNLSENIMIIDLLRNDIARICIPGTVNTHSLFEIESYNTLHQMISGVCGKISPNLKIKDIFSALFPCGSITGVPKIKSMQVLQQLEETPRGIYCGAIGFISPTSTMRFSVAIRTITLFPDNRAILNVGGAVTYESNAEAEYEECLLKSRFAI
ncbi:aminodeoxychorismate synthase component I [Candidatus Liberibacter americanus]|uniref:Anthranilate/para-aminobenzoate synthases component I n=1 Tax=Candidatus Liberibacter americanus str. Sao Paulo TaxID=1261131 RepID=U6B7V0_9HYPH|nr:aminodeoxychorismate synthase component I [Candidatus Liberibacter americanus]AHA27802.1 Anthranilate/para-aminobenzoate synthases component I [Candidatus Liberibacter americanus str. Sao Paulo]EMS36185.1 aminodeoxychorismate synthase [Candidatus Liberibacter americanus PW_SP]